MKHLTDDEIQTYFQTGRSDKWLQIEDHLNNCTDCQKQLLLYEKLGEMLVSTSSRPIPKRFEKAVMERLQRTKRQKRKSDVIVTFVALVGISIAGAIVLLTPQLKEIVTNYLMDVWEYGIQCTLAADGSTDALTVPLLGIILLMLFESVDRLVATRLKSITLVQK